jgi:hypothetical protein
MPSKYIYSLPLTPPLLKIQSIILKECLFFKPKFIFIALVTLKVMLFISENNNQMITLSQLPVQLNEAL